MTHYYVKMNSENECPPITLTTPINSLDYNMCHANRGLCVIFDNENFARAERFGLLSKRYGSHVDANNLSNVFTKFGFKVEIFKDMTASQITRTLKKVASLDHSSSDCFVCCVLTHGQYGSLYSFDDRYPLETLFNEFVGYRCPSLVGKPKLFFIQACQGQRVDRGIPVLPPRDSIDGVAAYLRIPTYADFLIAHSTIPGFIAVRNTDRGSWFIDSLVEMLQEYCEKYDLLTIMTLVTQRVSYNYQSANADPEYAGIKQVPCVTSMLTRRVFLGPKYINI